MRVPFYMAVCAEDVRGGGWGAWARVASEHKDENRLEH